MVPEPIPATREIPIRRPVVKPLAPDTYKVQFTLSATGYQKLRRAQDLLRHAIPNGDVSAVMERALTLLVEDLEKKKLAATRRRRASRPATRGSRHIPAPVRREVWRRDDGQCAFVGSLGRCTERGFLELHHVVPFADGGEASVDNLQLRCHAHNQHEATLAFGAHVVREKAPAYGEPWARSGPSRVETPWRNDMRPARPVDPSTGFPELCTDREQDEKRDPTRLSRTLSSPRIRRDVITRPRAARGESERPLSRRSSGDTSLAGGASAAARMSRRAGYPPLAADGGWCHPEPPRLKCERSGVSRGRAEAS